VNFYRALLWTHSKALRYCTHSEGICTRRVHPLTEWTIPDFSFPAEVGPHLPLERDGSLSWPGNTAYLLIVVTYLCYSCYFPLNFFSSSATTSVPPLLLLTLLIPIPPPPLLLLLLLLLLLPVVVVVIEVLLLLLVVLLVVLVLVLLVIEVIYYYYK